MNNIHGGDRTEIYTKWNTVSGNRKAVGNSSMSRSQFSAFLHLGCIWDPEKMCQTCERKTSGVSGSHVFEKVVFWSVKSCRRLLTYLNVNHQSHNLSLFPQSCSTPFWEKWSELWSSMGWVEDFLHRNTRTWSHWLKWISSRSGTDEN